jgi:hypothetical protein
MRIRSTLGFSILSSMALTSALVACSGDDSNTTPAAADSGGATIPKDSGSGAADGGGATTPNDSGSHDATVTEDSAASPDTGTGSEAASPGSDAGDAGDATVALDASVPSGQVLVTSVDPGVLPVAVTINQGTAIGEGAMNGATPSTLTNVAADPKNTQTVVSATNPFVAKGAVPDTAAGFCDYSSATPTRISYVTGPKFGIGADGGPSTDQMVAMAPFYFPLVYTTTLTTAGNVQTSAKPIIGLFDWRPKDIDEAVVVAESDDNGLTWYFMQTVLELNPDYTNPISGGYSATSTNTGCPAAVTGTNANTTSVTGSQADDGWGHAAIVQLPGDKNAQTGQFLYLLDRNTNDLPGTTTSVVDNAPLHVINLTGVSKKFPIWNTNGGDPGANDIKSISSALTNTADAGAPVLVEDTEGLLNPDGIMAVFPTGAADAGSPVTVLYVQKILDGDDTGPTALPTAQQCEKAPVSGKTNHDISNVRLATTTDGVHFVTDPAIVQGLNDPTTVDYNRTRWISPRGTLLDIHGDGSRWGLYFSGGNCLDGDSDAFHYIGYAESTDMKNWTVYNDVNSPIASINTITTANQADGQTVTIPANPPVFPTQPWFAERLYAPTAVRIDATHLSMTFAGYGVQTPATDLLDYRQIGNVVLTVSQPLPDGVPNNINAH